MKEQNRVKKRCSERHCVMKRFLAGLLVVCIMWLEVLPAYAFQQTPDRETIIFFTNEVSNAEESVIRNELESIIDTITFMGKGGDEYEYGTPLSVIGYSDDYVIPLYVDGKCSFIVLISGTEDGYSVSYGEDGAYVFGSLQNGTYCIQAEDDFLYIVDSSGKRMKLQNNAAWQNIDGCGPENIEGGTAVPYEKTKLPYSGGNAKSLIGKTLQVPMVANGGYYGYCWLSSAMSIVRYFEPTSSVSLANAHTYIHGTGHSLYLCNSGNRTGAKGVIEHYAGLTGTNTTSRCNAANTLTSIQGGNPIYMSLQRTDSATNTIIGHACVICGYTLNNTTGAFTYVIMDPNYSSYKYQTSTYSAASVVYTPSSGKNYTWTGALYDWN